MTIASIFRRWIDLVRNWIGPAAPIEEIPVEAPAPTPGKPLVQTADDGIDTAEPWYAYWCGLKAGELWALGQRHRTRLTRYFDWWKANREKLPPNALEKAAEALHNWGEQPPKDFWSQYAPALPPCDDPEAVQKFLDGVRWGSHYAFEHGRQQRIDAYHAERQRKREEKRRFKGMAMSADV